MSKTTASLLAAGVLVAASLAMAASRRYVLGPEIDGPRGEGAWRITVQASGRLADRRRPVVLSLPPDFRAQHIFRERFRSRQLNAHLTKRKLGAPRKAVWRPDGPNPVSDFQLSYSFSCLLPMPQPTPSMQRNSAALDAAPPALPKNAGVPGAAEILKAAREHVAEGQSDFEKVRVLYDFVSELGNDPAYESKSARDCLRDGSGDSGGKARLLAALCRALGIPARVLTGLVLTRDDPAPALHGWTEALVQGRWLAMDPSRFVFADTGPIPNYLVLLVGDRELLAGAGAVELSFRVDAAPGLLVAGERDSSPARRFWQRLSLHRLRPGEQHLVKFLLLLPLAALIVSIFRTIIGVPTFGTFSPALLGVAFLDVRALRWGLPIFLGLVLMGWGMRHWLERFHLLQVPRISALLTLIVILLLLLIVAAGNWGVGTTQYIALYPLVILTHLVERFWTVEAEDGAASSFQSLLGTAIVSVAISLCLAPETVSSWMFRYPETLGVVLAAQFALGRYTGYRISELYRFSDLLPAGPAASSSAASSEPPAQQVEERRP